MQRKKIKYEINGIVENKKNYDTCVKNAVIFHVAYIYIYTYIYKTKSKGFFFVRTTYGILM